MGRLGQINEAEQTLEKLIGKGAHPDVTQYVQGEVYFAMEDYLAAETAFLDALEQAESPALTRRCYISLGDLYRDCAALSRVSASPIQYPATKAAQLLSEAVVQEGLRYDSVLWDTIPKYVYYFLMLNYENTRRVGSGNNQKALNKERVRALRFPFTSFEEQSLIVQEIESRLSVCDSIQKTVDTALQQAEALRQSIVKNAFEGNI